MLRSKVTTKTTIQVTTKATIHSFFFSPLSQNEYTDSEWKQLQRNCDMVFETMYQTLDMPSFI